MVRRRGVGVAATVVALAALSFACGRAEEAATATFTPATPGTLLVAAALPAPGFWDGETPDDVTGGFEWALAVELADGLELDLRIVDVPFERIAAGDLGGADVAIAQISITDERADRMEFSVPYLSSDAGVLAMQGTEIPDLREARELRWVTLAGSTEEDLLADVVRPEADVLLVPDEVTAAAAVLEGAADAALIDASSALVLARGEERLEAVARFETNEEYGIAVPLSAEDPDANREAVDVVLRRLRSEGTLGDLEELLEAALGGDPDDLPVIRTR